VTSVEMAVVAPIVVLVMFAIVEFSLMCGCLTQVNNVARNAARAAAAGEGLTQIEARVADSLSGLDAGDLTITLSMRAYLGEATWSDTWVTLGDAGSLNTAELNDQVRCVAEYDYHLAIPSLFGAFADDAGAGTRTLHATTVMTRG
jgi:Flp pilus assembly protein TadG